MVRLPTPTELRHIREKLGLTQANLAKKTGLSQSMIARVETGSVDPRLSTLNKIVQALETAEAKKHKISVATIMKSPVISVAPEERVERAARLMEQHDISQLPIISGRTCVGSISETTIIHGITSEKDLTNLSQRSVQEVMDDPFPIITPKTDIESLHSLLEHNPAVLVARKGGEIQGIVTKADLLHLLHG